MAVGFWVAAWQAPHHARDEIRADLAMDYRPWIAAAGCSLVVAAAFALRALKTPERRAGSIALTALLALLAVQCLSWGYQSQSPLRSSRLTAEAIEPYLAPDMQIFSIRHYPQSLPFYIRRIITLVDVEDELKMGIQQEPERWVATLEDFEQRWRIADRAIALMGRADYEEFEKQGLPMKLIFTGPERLAALKP
jgi:hypothetical protein